MVGVTETGAASAAEAAAGREVEATSSEVIGGTRTLAAGSAGGLEDWKRRLKMCRASTRLSRALHKRRFETDNIEISAGRERVRAEYSPNEQMEVLSADNVSNKRMAKDECRVMEPAA